MAETAFGVKYDGPAVANHRMPIRDLAPALLALGDVFTEASLVLYPDRDPVALHVQATSEGSFMVDLVLQSVPQFNQVIDLLNSDEADALANLQSIVLGLAGAGGFGGGLIWLIKKIRNRRIVDEAETPDPGRVKLTLEDGTTFEASGEAVHLYRSPRIRRSTRAVVEPLTRDGVERLEFKIDSETTLFVEDDEVAAFDVSEAEPVPLLDDVQTRIVSIASVSFTEGNKWRFTDGEAVFHAAIEDERFLARVDEGEVFAKGDMLKCRMRIVQTKTEKGLHSDYYVIEVLEHIRREPPLELWPRDDG